MSSRGGKTWTTWTRSLLHNVTRTTIARWIYLGLREQREDQSFRELIDTIDRRISRSVRNNLTTL